MPTEQEFGKAFFPAQFDNGGRDKHRSDLAVFRKKRLARLMVIIEHSFCLLSRKEFLVELKESFGLVEQASSEN